VLVIDHDADGAETMKTALELSGHVVDVAFSGFDGVARARVQPPDLVICDVGLPGMDGYQVARALRADPALASIPLVAVSGYAQPEDLERSRAAGFDLHLAKPVDIDPLEHAMARAFAHASSGRASSA
jgi:CheY-like chemotaxis protein